MKVMVAYRSARHCFVEFCNVFVVLCSRNGHGTSRSEEKVYWSWIRWGRKWWWWSEEMVVAKAKQGMKNQGKNQAKTMEKEEKK